MVPSFKSHNGLVASVDCLDWGDFQQKVHDYLVKFPKRQKISRDYLFRGQSCSSWPLVASYDRLNLTLSPADADEKYDRMMTEFARAYENYGDISSQGVSYLNIAAGSPNPTELEALAQHFGLATRLMDWSHSLYVAAFFAFSKLSECESDLVSVWALHTPTLAHFSKDHLVARMDAYKANTRHLWQWAAFLRNRTPDPDLRTLFSAGSRYYDKRLAAGYPALIRFDIPSSEVERAMDDLHAMRINSITIFPGIEGVVQWIRSGGSLPS